MSDESKGLNGHNGVPRQTILNAQALNHPKVVEFAQAISRAQQTGNMDLIRAFLLTELATFVAANYGAAVFECAAVTAADLLLHVRTIVDHDRKAAAGEQQQQSQIVAA